MRDGDQSRAAEVASKICDCWNKLAKRHDWPERMSPDRIKRDRKNLSVAVAGLESLKGTRTEETLLEWLLSRWNWTKSPAPVSLAGSRNQWDALKLSLARESEEKQEHLSRRLEAVSDWTRKEITRRTSSGIGRADAAEQTLEFAHASGKIKGWKKEELQRFLEELEPKENEHQA